MSMEDLMKVLMQSTAGGAAASGSGGDAMSQVLGGLLGGGQQSGGGDVLSQVIGGLLGGGQQGGGSPIGRSARRITADHRRAAGFGGSCPRAVVIRLRAQTIPS